MLSLPCPHIGAEMTDSEGGEDNTVANKGASRARNLTRKLQQLEQSLDTPLKSTGLLGYVQSVIKISYGSPCVCL